jgi:hypothetical protein
MSTQTPLQSEPVACSTNWYTRWACKFQTLIEPLCEKQSDFALNAYEQNHLELDIRATNTGVSFNFFNLDRTSAEWLEIIEQEGWAMSEGTAKILAPRLTLWNKLGLSVWKAFSVGTTCSCCLSYRLILVILFSGLVGYWIK